MNFKTKENEKSFHVQCFWCGAKIRDDKQRNASGVCLQCFYRNMTNHLNAQKQSACGDFVSDR